MNWLNRTLAFAYRSWVFSIRNGFGFAELIFWPIIGVVSIGLMAKYFQFNSQELGFVLSGAIAMGVLQVIQLDVAYALLYDIWGKSLKQTFLTPTGIYEYILGPWIVGLLRGLICFIILYICSTLMFPFYLPGFLHTLQFFFGLGISGLIIGLMVCVLVVLFGQRAEITAWSLATILMLVSGIYYPVSELPKSVKAIALVFPLTYFLDDFRFYYGFNSGFHHSFLKAFALSIIYIFLSFMTMESAFMRSRKNGTMLRLSE
ncbi:MAG: ABC transporter permease [Candidatus Aminicenantia bacterium]